MYTSFDSVFCITLTSSTERQNSISAMAHRLDIPVQFYRVERMSNPVEGSWTSHTNIIRYAFESGLNNALIFEDDAIESKQYNDIILRDSLNFMRQNQNWDMFYLGWCPGHPVNDYNKFFSCLMPQKVPGYQYVYKCNCFCQHAYVISRRGMQKFLKTIPPFSGKQLDIAILDMNLNIYMCSPMLFDQQWCIGNTKTSKVTQECNLSKTVNIATASSYGVTYLRTFLCFYIVMLILVIVVIIFIK